MNLIHLFLFCLYPLGAPVLSQVFNFREHCTMLHGRNKTSVRCDGSNIMIKNMIIDERSIASLSSVELSHFHSLSFPSTGRVVEITIRNTKAVNVAVSFRGLEELTVESVGELRLTHTAGNIQQTTVQRVVLNNIKKLILISKNGSWWPVNSVTLNQIDSIDIVMSSLKVKGNDFTIFKSKMNLENSVVLLHSAMVKVDDSVLYINKGGLLNISGSETISVTNTNTHLMDKGSMTLLNCHQASLEDNLFYGLEYSTFKVLGCANVNFVQNGFFLSAITDVLQLASSHVRFARNSFDCSYCIRNRDLLKANLEVLGDNNYCYLNCNITLNKFKTLLEKDICKDPNQFIVEGKLCPTKVKTTIVVCLLGISAVVVAVATAVATYLFLRRKEYTDVNPTRVFVTSGNSCRRSETRETTPLTRLSCHLYEEVRTRD